MRTSSGRSLADDPGGILTLGFLVTSGAARRRGARWHALNPAYDITESRPWWKVRWPAIGLTLGLASSSSVFVPSCSLGPRVAEYVAGSTGLGAGVQWTWKVLQWPVIFVLVAPRPRCVYYFAPDAEQDWVWVTPGSVLATVLWLLASLGFKLYVARFGTYTETYGAIGGVMVLLLWFYLSGVVILIGAELNAEIEHASPYGKAPGEKVPERRRGSARSRERHYEERKAKGEIPIEPFPEGVNCDIESGKRATRTAACGRATS